MSAGTLRGLRAGCQGRSSRDTTLTRMPQPALRRALGRWDLTAIGVNQVIGGAIFLLTRSEARLRGWLFGLELLLERLTGRRWGEAAITRWVADLTRGRALLTSRRRDVILLGGGLFLVAKATHEIYEKLEVESADEEAAEAAEEEEARAAARKRANLFAWTIAQILVLDIVFSLDSVITAVGMTPHIQLMIIAVIAAAAVMLIFSGPISDFVHKHPTFKMLALAFLILIGVMLVAEGFGQHIDKGYIYFAMAFSLIVEVLNMRMRRKAAPVPLRHSELPE